MTKCPDHTCDPRIDTPDKFDFPNKQTNFQIDIMAMTQQKM